MKGFGFKKVDKLALKLKPELLESRERCIAFISYYLTEIGENDGHTWCSVDILKAAVEDSAPECIDVFDGVIENNSFLHQYENRIGLKLYYNLEMKILKGEYIKIVYDGLIENCYIDLKQLNKIKKFIKKNEYEYIGLFFEDIEPVIEVMKYLNENSKAINELLYTSIDLQEGGD